MRAWAADFMHSLFFWPASPPPPPPCLSWTSGPGMRFGNQFAGLVNAIREAERCSLPCVSSWAEGRKLLAPLFEVPATLYIDKGRSYHELGRHHNTSGVARPCSLHFYQGDGSIDDWVDGRRVVERYVFQLLHKRYRDGLRGLGAHAVGPKVMRSDTLVVHLRGTDALDPRLVAVYGYTYVQPPCAHYVSLIRARNYMEVRIVSDGAAPKGGPPGSSLAVDDDDRHPCMRMLKAAHKNLRFAHAAPTNGSALLEKDIARSFLELAAARSLAMAASSTFSIAAMLMSDPLRPKTVAAHLPVLGVHLNLPRSLGLISLWAALQPRS